MMWDYSQHTLEQLEKIQYNYEELGEIEGPADDEQIAELEAEIKRRKEKGYQYVLAFVAVNNETYEEWERAILLYELPEDVKKTVESTYDGVWVPEKDSIELFKLTPMELP